jgi:drug/metabolite transporter (DMT)-like permease
MRGILLVLLAVTLFSCSDALSKQLAASLPAIEIAWLRYVGFVALVLPVVVAQGGPAVLRTRHLRLHVLRALGLLGSTVIFVAGLAYLQMAEATATSFVAPIFVTALSIPLLREKVGVRRWEAVVVGLVGVLIIVRPGGGGFQLAALFPVASALCWAFALVFTRMMSGEAAITTLAYAALIGIGVSSLLLPFHWVTPSATEIGIAALMALASTTAQWLIILAFRQADASLLAPFSYVQLLSSVAFGYLLFAAVPDLWTWVGAAVIVASGVYTAHRERVRARERARS